MYLSIGRTPDVNTGQLRWFIHGKGQISTVGGPWVGGNPSARVLRNLYDLLVVQRDDKELAILVAKGDPLAVRRPTELVQHCMQPVRELLRFTQSVLVDQVQFVFAVRV